MWIESRTEDLHGFLFFGGLESLVQCAIENCFVSDLWCRVILVFHTVKNIPRLPRPAPISRRIIRLVLRKSV
jgi:hypothetical protein